MFLKMHRWNIIQNWSQMNPMSTRKSESAKELMDNFYNIFAEGHGFRVISSFQVEIVAHKSVKIAVQQN